MGRDVGSGKETVALLQVTLRVLLLAPCNETWEDFDEFGWCRTWVRGRDGGRWVRTAGCAFAPQKKAAARGCRPNELLADGASMEDGDQAAWFCNNRRSEPTISPLPIGMVRGFSASGSSRLRSMVSRPSRKSAPATCMCSASSNRRVNGRFAMPGWSTSPMWSAFRSPVTVR